MPWFNAAVATTTMNSFRFFFPLRFTLKFDGNALTERTSRPTAKSHTELSASIIALRQRESTCMLWCMLLGAMKT